MGRIRGARAENYVTHSLFCRHTIHQSHAMHTPTVNLWPEIANRNILQANKNVIVPNKNDSASDKPKRSSFPFAGARLSACNFNKSQKPTQKLIDYDIKCVALSNNNGRMASIACVICLVKRTRRLSNNECGAHGRPGPLSAPNRLSTVACERRLIY